jgi:hypothetical protein
LSKVEIWKATLSESSMHERHYWFQNMSIGMYKCIGSVFNDVGGMDVPCKSNRLIKYISTMNIICQYVNLEILATG